MKSIKIVLIFFLIFNSFGCKDDKNTSEETYTEPTISTFYFIRHAEKDRNDYENVDPELNQKGLGRAMHWAEILNDVTLDAIYTTDYERTTMTAAPVSVKQDITLQYYDPEILDIEQFKVDNLNKNVLVVGHSNTTPELVNMIIGEDKYDDMDDHDNGSLFIVQITDGKASDMRLFFNCNCSSER
ncbi:MAG: phosphoglycerate mutase family protein [Flavobacteriaceae bacterium]